LKWQELGDFPEKSRRDRKIVEPGPVISLTVESSGIKTSLLILHLLPQGEKGIKTITPHPTPSPSRGEGNKDITPHPTPSPSRGEGNKDITPHPTPSPSRGEGNKDNHPSSYTFSLKGRRE